MNTKNTRSPFYKSILIAVCLALMLYTVAMAAAGDLDTNFSGDGRIIQSFGGTSHSGQDIAVQTDGEVVVVGQRVTSSGSDFAIARYLTNGRPDTTFSGDGRQVVNFSMNDSAYGVTIQADGKIVVVGVCGRDFYSEDLALARLNPDGSLDTSFSGDGKVITKFGTGKNGGYDIALLGSKIVVVGYSNDGFGPIATVYQYLSNGILDTTFSGDGILTVDFGDYDQFNAVAVSSGKIYASGTMFDEFFNETNIMMARINSNGTLDTTFSSDGKVTTGFSGGPSSSSDLVISNTGKVAIVGHFDTGVETYFAIMRYTNSGVLDTTFDSDGTALLKVEGGSSPTGITIQNGKLVVAGTTGGTTRNGLLARFTATGILDTTFSGDGIATTNWGGNDYYQSVLFKGGRLYVVGYSSASSISRFIVAAYLP